VPIQPLPLSVVPSSVVPIFSNTIVDIGPHYSTSVHTTSQRNIIPANVFESYRLAQAKITPCLNKMNLVNPTPQQQNNPNWAGFTKFKKDLANVVKTKLAIFVI
jgi:hypothetical protein